VPVPNTVVMSVLLDASNSQGVHNDRRKVFRIPLHCVSIFHASYCTAVCPPMTKQHGVSERVSITRRQVLAASGTAVLTSTAGCGAVTNLIGNQVLEEVNVLNQLNREVSGSIAVVDPPGNTVLNKTFDVPSTESDEGSNVVAYDDVWTTTGEYGISVELTDVEIEGTSEANQTVSIENTEEQMVAVSIGSGDEDRPIVIRVGESFSGFAQENKTS